MKCFVCKKEIKDELKMKHIGDGDFVCDDKCEKKFEKEREEFFNNISDDNWYGNYMNF